MTTQWTDEQKLAALLQMPWTLKFDREDDGTLIAQVQELPDAIATGSRSRDLQRDLWDALTESLAARLANGDEIVLPQGVLAPWDKGEAPKDQPRIRRATAFVHADAFVTNTVPAGSMAMALPPAA